MKTAPVFPGLSLWLLMEATLCSLCLCGENFPPFSGAAASLARFSFILNAPALLSLPGESFPVALIDQHEFLPPLLMVPSERRLDRRARHPCPGDQLEGDPNNRPLHSGIPGFPAGIAQGKVRKHKAGNPAFFHDVAGGTHDDGGNAVFLQVPGNQTHGLVAHRSEG